jgi:ribosome-associated translation inhibitor RaiA
MSIPLKVVDHGRLLTEGLADHIRERTEKLGHFFGRVKQCRVTVDGPGQHPLQGRVRVRITLSLPDAQIAINRQTGANLPMAIRESFDAADQRLEDYVRLSRLSVKGAKRRPKRSASLRD